MAFDKDAFLTALDSMTVMVSSADRNASLSNAILIS